LAFLEYDPKQAPATGQTNGAGWYNWLSYVMAGHPVIHVQPVFVGKDRYYTYSADKTNGVSAFETRKFAGKWRFIEIYVREEQELAMRNFFVSQLGKPFSFWGTVWLYSMIPRKTTGYEWFCSELTVRGLQHAGLLCRWKDAWTVKPHVLYLHLLNEFTERERFILNCNPVAFDAAARNGTLSFDYGFKNEIEEV
jgi:hypothetical protein